MKHLRNILTLVTIPIIAITNLTFLGCGNDSDESASVESQIVRITRGNIETRITSLGTIALPDQEDLTFGSSGTVIELLVREGDTVEQGQTLAKMDSNSLASLEKAMVQAEIGLKDAQDALAEAQNPYSEADIAQAEANVASAKINLENATEALENVLTPYTEAQIDAAKAAVAELRLALYETKQQAEDDMDIAEQVYSQARDSFINTATIVVYESDQYEEIIQAWEEAKLTYESTILSINEEVSSAEGDLAEAQEISDEMMAGANPVEVEKFEKLLIVSQANLDDAEDILSEMLAGADPADVRLKELEVINAQTALREAQEKLVAVNMVAPFNGIVSTVNVVVGDDVTANESIIHLVNANVVEVDASVDEIDVAQVEQGLLAMITLDALPNTMLRGRVASVATLATSQSGVVTYGLVIEVLNPEGVGLKEGMSATIEIVAIQAENVIRVPSQAITRNGMNQVVQVMIDEITEETEERIVETGETNGTMTEITSGLTEGEQVKVTASASTSNTSNQYFPGGGGFPGGGEFFLRDGGGGGFRPHD